MNLKGWFPCGSHQHYEGLDTAGTHVTESGNVQSSILTGITNLIQELHNQLHLNASTTKVVSHWLLPLSTQSTGHENQEYDFQMLQVLP
jgi:hypothetical protein